MWLKLVNNVIKHIKTGLKRIFNIYIYWVLFYDLYFSYIYSNKLIFWDKGVSDDQYWGLYIINHIFFSSKLANLRPICAFCKSKNNTIFLDQKSILKYEKCSEFLILAHYLYIIKTILNIMYLYASSDWILHKNMNHICIYIYIFNYKSDTKYYVFVSILLFNST